MEESGAKICMNPDVGNDGVSAEESLEGAVAGVKGNLHD